MINNITNNSLPPQMLPFSRKNKAWRKKHLDWASSKSFFNYSPVRRSVLHKKINYDLINGILHMDDLQAVLNPENIRAGFIPESIQHYSIMNSKMNVLRGEETKRVFDFRVCVTNPNAISEIERTKKQLISSEIQRLILDKAKSEEEFNAELEKLNDFFTFEWQDMREVRANALLNHYMKEYNMPLMFNNGFVDAMTVSEELYQCDIVGGEPVIEKLNPMKVRIFKSGHSNRVEDADMIVIEDYWSPGRVIDTYYDVLSKKDMDYLEKYPNSVDRGAVDSMGNVDERYGFVNSLDYGNAVTSEEGFFWNPEAAMGIDRSLSPFDTAGNIRVLRVYWKSRRKIKKVKSIDPMIGEEIYTFYPETYVLKPELGEEEEIFYINEAWEGTKIGNDIYVNMRPRPVQYNRLSNPSRCHFGIVGSIYNVNDSKPFSLVDMMKPYSYLYDVIHDRLNKMIAKNWGKIITLDLAKVPKGWDVEKWMYYAKTNSMAVVDSFKEGNIGAATGKLAGALNNASSGVIDAELGNSIQLLVNLLEFIKMEMSDVAGISKQREGLISNRETVGGVERATLQSSHITEYLFATHDDVKRRALEVFLETAKIAIKGKSKKFQYILSDNSMKVMDIDGDEFAEADYGLVVDNSNGLQELQQKMDVLMQAALQNQMINFSTVMKLYNSSSLAEKQRMIEKNEQEIMQRQQEAQQQQLLTQQQDAQQKAELEQAKLQLQDTINQRDNETKLIIAGMGQDNGQEQEFSEESRATLMEKIREFDEKLKRDDEKLKLERERLQLDKNKAKTDAELREKQINRQSRTTTKK